MGYGPHPNECIERLREYNAVCIAGNHDWAVLNKLDVDEFNDNARYAVLWTRERLTATNMDYLDKLPLYSLQEKNFTLVHGSPRHPIWEYILYPKIAQINFVHFETPYCLVGHTHSPVVFVESNEPAVMCQAIVPEPNQYIYSLNSQRVIINPGSVGQPRDGDARAAYGILNTDTMQFEIKRIPYNISVVQEVMKQNNFPPKLWNRLAFGY